MALQPAVELERPEKQKKEWWSAGRLPQHEDICGADCARAKHVELEEEEEEQGQE